MLNSIQSTTCSSPKDVTLEEVIQNDGIRYKKKGYGLIYSLLYSFYLFYFISKISLQQLGKNSI